MSKVKFSALSIRAFEKAFLVAIVVCFGNVICIEADAKDISSLYQTRRVAIGGGGFIENVRYNSLRQDLLYARGDCDGFFKWVPDNITPESGHWVDLCDNFKTSQNNMYGCLAFDFDPKDSSTLYAAIGITAGPFDECSSEGIYKSLDEGNHWELLLQTKVAANWGGHTYGNSLAVDPSNHNVIYYGSQEWVQNGSGAGPVVVGGLFVTIDGGKNWNTNPSAPLGEKVEATNNWGFSDGPRTVICDPRQGHIQVEGIVRTKVVYLAYTTKPSFPGGIYQSIDGGLTFSPMKGAPANPATITLVGKQGDKLVISTLDHGVWIYADGKWTNGEQTGTDGNGVSGMAVDPFNDQRLIARGNGFIWRSIDGGLSWKHGKKEQGDGQTDILAKHSDKLWTWIFAGGDGGSANVAFDPFREGTAITADPFSISRTGNVWDKVSTWYPLVYGLETTGGLWLACPPAPSRDLLLYGCQDVRGFISRDLAIYPQRVEPANSGEGGTYDRCFAFCESEPDDIVAVKQEGAKNIFTSKDGGDTWVQQNAPPDTNLTGGFTGHQIAVSSKDPDLAVFLDKKQKPYFTTQLFSAPSLGLTWTKSDIDLTDYNPTGADQYQANISGLVSDKVNGKTFYLDATEVTGAKPNRVYASKDGGASFQVPANQVIPWRKNWAQLITTPEFENDIWALAGAANNNAGVLWHSQDGAVTWQNVPAQSDIQYIFAYALGKNAPGTANPTLFFVGEYKKSWGVFRSTDLGNSFDQISNDDNIGKVAGARGFNNVTCMAGDRRVFGRVYINNWCTGISYLEPKGSSTTP